MISCKLYHKTTWFETCALLRSFYQTNLVANYITKLRGLKPNETEQAKIIFNAVANYITKLRGLKQSAMLLAKPRSLSCKLYHKTTWFETKARGIFAPLVISCKLYHKTTWFETLERVK